MDQKRRREKKESLKNILATTALLVDPDRSNFDAVVHWGAMAAVIKEKWFALLLDRYLSQTSV